MNRTCVAMGTAVAATLWIAFEVSAAFAQSSQPSAPAAARSWGAKEGEACVGCHAPMNPALTEENGAAVRTARKALIASIVIAPR